MSGRTSAGKLDVHVDVAFEPCAFFDDDAWRAEISDDRAPGAKCDDVGSDDIAFDAAFDGDGDYLDVGDDFAVGFDGEVSVEGNRSLDSPFDGDGFVSG